MCEECENLMSTCLNCCYRYGKEDRRDGEPYENPYKNWDQVNAYDDGYKDQEKLQDWA